MKYCTLLLSVLVVLVGCSQETTNRQTAVDDLAALTHKINTLQEQKEVLEKDLALVKAHSIVFVAKINKVLKDSQGEFNFTAEGKQGNQRVTYFCLNTGQIGDKVSKTRQYVAQSLQLKAASGDAVDLIISGHLKDINRGENGSTIFLTDCFMF